MTRGPKPKEVSEQSRKELAEIRQGAKLAAEKSILNDESGFNPLQLVAWAAGHQEVDDLLRQTVQTARDAGATWKEIAIALGEPDDKASTNKVKNRFFYHSQSS